MNPNDATLMEAARNIVPFVASLDPGWAAKLDAMDKERGWDDLQKVCALMGNSLDQDAHMWIPPHPFFMDNHIPTGSKIECPVCHEIYIAAYPGQPICGNKCAPSFYAKKANDEASNDPVPDEILQDLKEAQSSRAASGAVGLRAVKEKAKAHSRD